MEENNNGRLKNKNDTPSVESQKKSREIVEKLKKQIKKKSISKIKKEILHCNIGN